MEKIWNFDRNKLICRNVSIFPVTFDNLVYDFGHRQSDFIFLVMPRKAYYKVELLIHEADPQSGPVVITIFKRPSFQLFKISLKISINKTNFEGNTGETIWVWPSGSLMTRTCLVLHNIGMVAVEKKVSSSSGLEPCLYHSTGCSRKYVYILLDYNFKMRLPFVNLIEWPGTTHMFDDTTKQA